MSRFPNCPLLLLILLWGTLFSGCQTPAGDPGPSPFQRGDTFEIAPVSGDLGDIPLGTPQSNAVLTQNTLAGILSEVGYELLPQGAGAKWILTSRWVVYPMPNPRVAAEGPETSFQLPPTVPVAYFLVSVQDAVTGRNVWNGSSPRPILLQAVPADEIVNTIRRAMQSFPVAP